MSHFFYITVAIILAFGSTSLLASDSFGEYPSELTVEAELNESIEIVKKSRELRKAFSSHRSIASFSSEDERWLNDFEKIMKDDKTDYLQKAMDL